MPNVRNYVLLETITVGAAGASSVTFNNIPQTGYTDLKLVVSARGTSSQINAVLQGTFNGSSATNYSWRQVQGNSSAASSASASSTAFVRCGYVPDNSTTSNTFANIELYIPNYTSSSAKSLSMDSVQENNSGTAGEALLNLIAGLWGLTSAITSISFNLSAGNFAQYSTFSLYGLAAVGTTPTIAPKAAGGDIIQTDGTYWYHAFITSGTFTPAKAISCDVLVVAGGGAGGGSFGGGGGAGGYLEFSAQSLSLNTSYTVTIGAGAAANNNTRGATGSDSQFGSLTLVKGGGGGAVYGGGTNAVGGNGGSGGGAASDSVNRAGGTATSGQGYKGGDVVGGLSGFYPNAGGGGAGGAGGSITSGSQAGGNGGVGIYSTLSDAMGAATSTGQLSGGHYYYAGGGGAGSFGGGGAGTGGLGGGASGTSGAGNNGTANTGGGGSGAGGNSGANSGAGGSGIVIVRYAVTA